MSTEQLEIDHVVMGVDDLDRAAAALLRTHGLVALPGGRHPSWGTENRIVPLGSAYLELVAVIEPDVARTSAFGSWVTDMAAGRTGWGWAVRTHDMAATASRLGLDVVPGSRVTDTGDQLSWQLAGVPDDAADRTLPFFIEWAEGTPHPGAAHAGHRDGDVRVSAVAIEADAAALVRRLGGADLPVVVRPGRRGVVTVECTADSGRILLEPFP
jgi:hypothetical protein